MESRRLPIAPMLGLLLALLAACTAPSSAPQARLQDQAAEEATAIVARAQATALVLRAQAQATALVERALAPTAAPAEAVISPKPTPTVAETRAAAESTPSASDSISPVEETTEEPGRVEVLDVEFGAEGAYITVNYLASPAAAQKFWPGVLSVTDEASGTIFSEVPVIPIIGPLIARPVEDGQPGYVMFVHEPAILHEGAKVTVVLADYRFEHISIK